MADTDIRKTVNTPESTKAAPVKGKTSEPVLDSGDNPDSAVGTDSDEVSGGNLADEAPEPDPTAPVLAVVPGDVAEDNDDITPTGNKPDAVQFPVTGPRLPGIYLDDVEKYQDEVKSAVIEGRAPDKSLDPFTGEDKDVTSDHSPAAQAAKSDHSNVNAH